jgi:hypothetical protein
MRHQLTLARRYLPPPVRYQKLNKYHFDGDTLVMLNNPDGREFYYEADVPDTADLSYKLLEHTWSFGFQANGKIQCVKTSINRRAITMHELIMKDVPHKPEQTIIAHLDGNPLNNRRSNLRWVTRSVSQHSTRDAENKPRRGIKHGNPLAYMTSHTGRKAFPQRVRPRNSILS